MTDRQLNLPPCKGLNCGTTTGRDHSPECEAEHAAAIAGGTFVPAAPAAQPEPQGEREAFEAWAITKLGPLGAEHPFLKRHSETGDYTSAWMSDRWDAWQARAALSAAPAAPQERPCHCERACVPEGEVCSRCGGVGQFRPAAPQEPQDTERDAARYRAIRATTRAITNSKGERIENFSSEEFDRAADSLVEKQSAAMKDKP